MKKIAILALAAFSLIACQTFASEEGDPTEPKESEAALTFQDANDSGEEKTS